MAEQTFDPRFDPAFQRGYVPPVQDAPVPPEVRDAELIASLPTGTAALFFGSSGTDGVGPGSATAASDTAQADAEPGITVAAEVRRGANPYVVILWVVGVVFAVGGAALLFGSYLWMLSIVPTGLVQGTAAQAMYVFGTVFGVPAVTVGLATIAGLVFFSAWRSSQRNGGTSS